MNVVSHCFLFLPVFLSSQEMPPTFLSMTEKHKWKSSDVQRRTPTWRFLFRSVTMTGLFGRSAWCEKLRSYALQSVRITLFAWVNPKSHMTRAACPVRMGRLGPENCYRRQQKKKKKTGGGEKTKHSLSESKYWLWGPSLRPGSLDHYSHENEVISR